MEQDVIETIVLFSNIPEDITVADLNWHIVQRAKSAFHVEILRSLNDSNGNNGFVWFSDPSEAYEIVGRNQQIRETIFKGEIYQYDPKEAYLIYVGGVPDGTSPHQLNEHFSQFGETWNARLIRDKYVGIVTFKSKSALDAALKDRHPKFLKTGVHYVRVKRGVPRRPLPTPVPAANYATRTNYNVGRRTPSHGGSENPRSYGNTSTRVRGGNQGTRMEFRPPTNYGTMEISSGNAAMNGPETAGTGYIHNHGTAFRPRGRIDCGNGDRVWGDNSHNYFHAASSLYPAARQGPGNATGYNGNHGHEPRARDVDNGNRRAAVDDIFSFFTKDLFDFGDPCKRPL